MSIDKWLEDEEWVEKKRKKEEQYKKLSEEEKKSLEVESIKNLIGKKQIEPQKNKGEIKTEKDYLLDKVIDFKNWLDNRTYLKGDRSEIKMWVSNLYRILESNSQNNQTQENWETKKELIKKYRRIPPDFLDEKTRVAINKKLYRNEMTSSDKYYLRKLKKEIEEKLKELKYYEILEDILDF